MFVANLLTIESITDHQLGSMDTGTLCPHEQELLERCGDDLILFHPLTFEFRA